jgi:hypothetical protein
MSFGKAASVLRYAPGKLLCGAKPRACFLANSLRCCPAHTSIGLYNKKAGSEKLARCADVGRTLASLYMQLRAGQRAFRDRLGQRIWFFISRIGTATGIKLA